MKIVADSHIPFIENYFAWCKKLILKPGRAIHADDVQDADVLLVRSVTHVNEKLLGHSRVKFVGSVTAGADHLDMEWLQQAGIDYSVALGFNAPPVADYVISVVAALQKKGLLKQKKIKAAVVGVGHVGRLVVERFKDLNFDVILCDPIRAQHETHFFSTPLEEFTDLDLITLHVPLVKSGEYMTHHFINKSFLQKQKSGCVLVNTSRGGVIHSQELLEYGRHLHWCFDVWEHEPKIDLGVLEKTLIATPHIAGYSVQSKMRGIDMIYKIMCDKKIIEPQSLSPVIIPAQALEFAIGKYQWQDIVLGVFNPRIVTTMMQTLLVANQDGGALFDEMRNQFNYRNEFSYTQIHPVDISVKDAALLRRFNFHYPE